MYISFNIERLVPRFLLADKNGYALAKAIERAFQIVAEKAQNGLNIILDVDKMPEWRLDELAKDYNCLYDFSADVESKRTWIKNARYMVEIVGTPEGVMQYLRGYFDDVSIEEAWDYEGDPFHFRVIIGGNWNESLEDWALRAIEHAKNARSVLDQVNVHLPEAGGTMQMYAGIALYGASSHAFGPIDVQDLDDETFLADGLGVMLMDGNGVALTC